MIMKRLSRLLVLLLVLSLSISLFSGCGSTATEAETPAETTAAETEAASSAPAEEAAPAETAAAEAQPSEDAAPAEEAAAPVEEPEDTYFPLEETGHFTYWFSYPPMFEGFADGPMDYLMYTESEKRLNVEIEWQAFSILNANEQFMLMIASNDYADAMQNFTSLYSGNVDDAIENEIIIDLTDLVETCAPDYNAARTASVTREKSSLTSSGAQAVMFGFNSTEGRTPAFGPVIRQDWLDELGLDTPVTVDDYHTVLTAFKNEMGATGAYALCADGTNTPGRLGTAYGVAVPTNNDSNGYYQIDGQLTFGPIQDGFRQMLETLHQWYSEGLISQNFVSDTNSLMSGSPDNTRIASGEVGIFTANAKNFANYEEMIGDGAEIQGIERVRLTEDQELHLGQEMDTAASNMGISVSAQAPDPELIVRYFNYFFTEEGSILANYGIEGETFNYNEKGDAVFTDLVLNNPDGMSVDVAMCLYGGGSTSGPYVVDHTKYVYIYDEKQTLAGERWVANCDGAYDLPNTLSSMMTADESEEFYSYYNDIMTVFSENVLKFITGDRSLDEFDDYVAQIEAIGIDKCTAIAQTAYDRYMAQ
jgi:putative aldouronate transport system substrate-binding protein